MANKFDNLKLNNFGLSTEDAELCMYVDQTNRGFSQLSTDDCPEAEKVVIKKLNDYFDTVLHGKSPYMIKIDVEGHELLALQGGEKIFQNDPPKLIFSEVTPKWFLKHDQTAMQYMEFFWSYDYTIYIADGLTKFERGSDIPAYAFDTVMVHSSIDLVV